MDLPSPTDTISGLAVQLLRGSAEPAEVLPALQGRLPPPSEALGHQGFQLALACLYELNYRGFDDVDEDLEWAPGILAVRALLEDRFESALRQLTPQPSLALLSMPVSAALQQVVDSSADSSVSSFLLRDATVDHFRDFCVQRSVYHLKEADPHTWQIPRLTGSAKAALVEIQYDEYGSGRAGRMHSQMFAASMRELGLDDTYGAYWSSALPETLATVNVMSLFGLHRRWRGASVGHLAALEMTSTSPNGRYANGLRRLGFGREATAFFDEHVEADAVHEQLAAVDLCGAFVEAEPRKRADVLWGASCCLALDARAGGALMSSWVQETAQSA